MTKFKKRNWRQMIMPLIYVFVIPLFLCFYLFHPFEKWEETCSENPCIWEGNNTIKIKYIQRKQIDNIFIKNIVQELFKTKLDFDRYDLIYIDLSNSSHPSISNFSTTINFRGINYTIPYKKGVLFKNKKINKDEKIVIYPILNYNYGERLKIGIAPSVSFDFKVVIRKPIKEFIVKSLVIFLIWLGFIRLIRKTYYYIIYEDRD